jgi:hypothetical protein
MPWSDRFDYPIPIPGRKPLRTLRDQAKFLMGLSRVRTNPTPLAGRF